MLWATGLQLSQDRNEYLVQHANKTAGASPTANHWLSACCLQLSPALPHYAPMPSAEPFAFSQFYKRFQPCLKQMCAFEGKILPSTWLLPVVCQRAQWSEENNGGDFRRQASRISTSDFVYLVQKHISMFLEEPKSVNLLLIGSAKQQCSAHLSSLTEQNCSELLHLSCSKRNLLPGAVSQLPNFDSFC